MQSTQPSDPALALIVIVNYRTGRLVVDCLRSLVSEVRGRPGTRVVVVDNQSGDDSVKVLHEAIDEFGWSDWVSLTVAPRNGGFAYGNNLSIRKALATESPPAYYWLLNPDTQVRPGALSALTGFLDRNPAVGVAGGMLEESDGSPWPFAFRFPSVLSELERGMRLSVVTRLLARWRVVHEMDARDAEVDWVCGANMMVRRQVFDSVGLMDEKYFLYFEETDFCLQAKRAGWASWYVPSCRVMHIAGQSTGLTGEHVALRRMPTYWFDSRRRYFLKNHNRAYAIAADLAWIVSFFTYQVRKRVQRKQDFDPPRLLSDFIRNSSLLNWG